MDVSKTIYDMENKMKLELDKRIPNKNCIFTSFDTECAEQYIGKQGYFTNCYSNFVNINSLVKGTLTKICDYSVNEKYATNVGEEFYSFFLPKDLLKTEEKFVPCTLDNFGLHIGDLIKFRRKDDHNYEICTMYMGHMKTNGTVKVLLGQCYYSFEVLFNEYEWFDKDSNTWEVFGVEE